MAPKTTFNYRVVPPETADSLRALIAKVHYQTGNARGAKYIGCYGNYDDLKPIIPNLGSDNADSQVLIGALVLQSGCAYSMPRGRRYLAKAHFPKLQLDTLARNDVVKKMGLVLIGRVAVDPVFQGLGAGTGLALEARKQAKVLFQDARFVEVMTSRRRDEWEKLKAGKNLQKDFLQSAGFQLAPITTRAKNPKERGGRDRTLYYWASVT